MNTTPIRIIDSHTGGEPTRVLVSGGPELGHGSMQERLQHMQSQHDHWRRALVNEPRGSEVLVGALLCEPQQADSACGVIFFNNVGYLGMCGHGSIGLIATLAHLGRIGPGRHKIETPVGPISATLAADGQVTLANVPSWRAAKNVAVDVPGHGRLHGDVAWGGNWFFLCEDHGQSLEVSNAEALTELAWRLRLALSAAGVRGDGGAEIDHIELIAPSRNPAHDPTKSARNFVLCPGKAYDRSPCGTGTSAKIACLAADGKLAPGELWQQESVIGSCFGASYQWGEQGQVLPQISGRAFVNLDAQLLLQPDDPFAWGLPA
ncbi:4-hydroxyproline epimerase [Paucibacter oligotrophus]|uniref:4-hydroxyproline epimerase n=1 Tax=Roseateles oligotrophus TaxID=1769250 RepID=A0A840LBJ4_9BURK|nr:proline racemase family protein [Roseateles oligotrophus]MBB4845540.1 4-hydroxyproline epimerase [Roseateles oligotrophus]